MITPIAKEDIQETAKILREYWKERGMEYTQQWAESYLRKGHAKDIKQDVTLTLKEGAAVVGVVAVVLHEGNLAELRDLVVRKGYRSKGYGEQLVRAALDFCFKNNARKITALAFPQHEEFFARFGFAREGYLRSHFKDNEDLVVMGRIAQHEAQADLRSKLEGLSLLQDIESTTSERLRKLKSKR